ncbi:MAG: M10 family metallopeptidase C-terminal domain-containing protein [Betaproteobacteria bacterium]|nr:M10 family metallopeptidase C-terminal domain-containing protein [Betaproteobacteria bacterium]
MATPYSSGVITAIADSGYSYIDGLLPASYWGYKWGGAVGSGVALGYSFPGYWHIGGGNFNRHWNGAVLFYDEPSVGSWQPVTADEISAFKSAAAEWASVANINFLPMSDTSSEVGEIRLTRTLETRYYNAAYAHYPEYAPEGGDIWLQPGIFDSDLSPGGFKYFALLHELGHALGLQHPHESGMPASLDSIEYTVMSYRAWVGDVADDNAYPAGMTFFPTTPMIYDIVAIQYLYGANLISHAGNDTYSWGPGQNIFETIWDTGGTDTLDWSNQSSNAIINLSEGAWSWLGPNRLSGPGPQYTNKNLALAFGTVIENANGGSGADWIYGNWTANDLRGNDGNDVLYGYAGNDELSGGSGNDIIFGGDGNDIISGGFDSDWLYGGAGDDSLVAGYTGIDVLIGGDGNDTLNARFAGTAETPGTYRTVMLGGAGNDSFTGSGGADWLDGGDHNDSLWGEAGNDAIFGGAGNDSLNGRFGNDWLWGGAGDDVLSGNQGIDGLFGGAGNDTFAFTAYELDAGLIDVIYDFGDAGADNDSILLTGIGRGAVQFYDDAAGTWMQMGIGAGGFAWAYIYRMSGAALADDILFA